MIKFNIMGIISSKKGGEPALADLRFIILLATFLNSDFYGIYQKKQRIYHCPGVAKGHVYGSFKGIATYLPLITFIL